MVGLGVGNEIDAEGDVVMQNAQPIYESIRAPRITSWDQESLLKWHRSRKQYETKIKERCAITGETYAHVAATVKGTIDPFILTHVARYIMSKEEKEITDEDLVKTIESRIKALRNAYVPDVEDLIKRELKMDLNETDIEARILKYFMSFNSIVETNGLQTLLGVTDSEDSNYKGSMKGRCKLLIEGLAPDMLRTEIQRMVSLTHRECKADDKKLYGLVLERAREQQHFYTLQNEKKRSMEKKNKSIKKINTVQKKDKVNNQKKKEYKQPKESVKSPRTGCWVCKGDHWLKDCPNANEQDKDNALKEMAEVKKKNRSQIKSARTDYTPMTVTVNNAVEVTLRADSGADINVIPGAVAEQLKAKGKLVERKELKHPIIATVAGGQDVKCISEYTVDLQVQTKAGTVNLSQVQCYVLDPDEDEFLLGKETLKSMGIDVDNMIASLASGSNTMATDVDDIPEPPEVRIHIPEDVQKHLLTLIGDASMEGFEQEWLPKLRELVLEYSDVWRTKVGADEPAKVEPLQVVLQADSQPYRCKPRKYAPLQSAFLKRHVQELEEAGFIYKNNVSRWACAAVPVKKPGTIHDYRLTNDYRPVNSRTVPIAAATPNLSVITSYVMGAKYFGKFDLFKGFWQLPLAEDCQELFSFMTDEAVYTPRRVPQGTRDSAVHFQMQMQEMFQDMLYHNIIIWIDDVVLYAKDVEEYLQVLEKFFNILRMRNLKLNAMKSSIYNSIVHWCGKIIDGDGVKQDPERLDGLLQLPRPESAAELQYLLCAANWLRDSLVDYARIARPLYELLEEALKGTNRKKARAAEKKLIWNERAVQSHAQLKELLLQSAKLTFPDPEANLCMFTDASDSGWAVVITQVKKWEEGKHVTQQNHELIICKGGAFTGSQRGWSVIEKEGYPIVHACETLEYILQREKGFTIYCDHSNLIHIFCPDDTVKQYLKGKLQRWCMKLSGYNYTIEHIKGLDNVWADIVSRWIHRENKAIKIKAVRTRSNQQQLSLLRPLQDERFAWPSRDELKELQQKNQAALQEAHDISDDLIYMSGNLWIPIEEEQFVTRILIIAHCGIHAHRGEEVMYNLLNEKYAIAALRKHIKDFIGTCLLCKHVKGGKLIQRPWDEPREPAMRNETLHFDYMYMGDSYGEKKYILVMKDELTHYCELTACTTPDSSTVVHSILQWYARFGLPETWQSDNGTHFANAVMNALSSRLGARHKFVPVYTPWINGTVERINRDILQVVRVLLLELSLATENWEYLLPLVQANLNHTPTESLDGKTPIELFTGLANLTLLDTIFLPGERNNLRTIDMSCIEQSINTLKCSLATMHQQVADKKIKRRLYQMAMKNGKYCNFTIGDFVLWSRVDSRLPNNKLMVTWVGPYKVVQALEHSFIIQHLITKQETNVHSTRLKFYADDSLNVNEEILEHIGHQGIQLTVRELMDHRWNGNVNAWELLVSWVGLENIENSWELLSSLYSDIPVLVTRYIDGLPNQDEADRIRQALSIE